MRDSPELSMRRYVEAARAHHDQHPDDEIRLHEAHLDSLGLSEGGKEYLIKNRLAPVAAYVQGAGGLRQKLAGMREEDQIRALQAIHASESENPTPGEEESNSETDRYVE